MDAAPDPDILSAWLPIMSGEILQTDGVRITQRVSFIGGPGKHYFSYREHLNSSLMLI